VTVRVHPRIHLCRNKLTVPQGTWENSDVGYEKGGLFGSGHPQVPTNVTRLSRSIVPEDSRQHPQIVYYQAGVGSGWSITDQLLGGGLAFGISENVREAYAFLAANYMVTDDLDADGDFIGDQIFLIGFSRGAFTARSVGGLLCSVGLLTKEAMQYFYYVFDDYQGAGSKKYVPKITTALPDFKISVPPIKTDEYLAAYKKELLRVSHPRLIKEDTRD